MKKKRKKFNMDILPALILFALFPVMAKGQLVDNPLSEFPWFYGGTQQYDFFMHWKSIIFLILVIWMVVVLVDRMIIRQKKILEWKCFFPLAVYSVLVILSAILSVNKELALKGMLEQYETVWVLTGYVVTVFYCSQVIESKKDVQIVLGAVCLGALLQGIIGVFQAAGVEFWDTTVGKALITIGMDESVKERLVFTFADSDANKVYMASYNPNYAGVYIILVLPIVIVCVKMFEKKWQKILALMVGIMLVICLVASGSKMGFLVAGVLIIMGAAAYAGNQKKKLGILGGCLFLVIIGIVLYDFAGNHRLSKAVARSAVKGNYLLTGLKPGENGVTVCFRENEFEVSIEHTGSEDILRVTQDGEKLPVYRDEESQRYCVDAEGYQGMSFDAYQQDGHDYLTIERNEVFWQFVKEDDGYTYINPYGNKDTIRDAYTILPGYEKALSGRGYIWGRTIPLLKKSLVWGSGPDTFAVVFPQNDYLYRYHAGKTLFTQIRTKAHNMYLQTALQTGVLSLVCLMIFAGKVLIQLWKERKRNVPLYMGMFLALAGYLLMGLLNDSVVAVAPVFWGLLGMAMALKRIEQ